MKKIIIYGSGGHAKVIADVIEKSGDYTIAGFIDDTKQTGEAIFGYQVLGGFAHLSQVAPQLAGGIVAIGDNFTRAAVMRRIADNLPTFSFITAIHPGATVARGVTIGAGSVVMAGAVINSDCAIGAHCILNTNCSIDHDCRLDDFSAVFPGATLAGNTSIGECSTIALGAKVIHGITIGKNSLIGAGSTVLCDIPDNSLAYGTPCKVIRKRKPDEKYL